MDSKVYITQNNNKNYAPAYMFGTPEFITNLEYCSIGNSEDNNVIKRQIKNIAEQYDPKNDYILLSGDPIIISLTVHAVLSAKKTIRILKWDSQDKIYIPITLDY